MTSIVNGLNEFRPQSLVAYASMQRLLAEEQLEGRQTLVVCKVGGRSAQATGYLAQQGLDVVNLDGGMLDWEAAGRPMVSETGQSPSVV